MKTHRETTQKSQTMHKIPSDDDTHGLWEDNISPMAEGVYQR